VAVCWTLALRSSLRTPPRTLLFEDHRGRFLAELSPDDRRHGFWPLPAALPDRIAACTLAAEDHRFHRHGGVDLRSVARAAVQNLRSGRRASGASTIAMQVARLQDPGPRSFPRKALEALAAREMVRRNGRDAVLRHYLTIAPYGPRIYGVVYAARRYFRKPVEDLTWAESAFLASLPRDPTGMDLTRLRGRRKALERAEHVLRRLRALGWISHEEHEEAVRHLPLLRPTARETRPRECLHAVLRIGEELAASRLDPPTSRPIVRTSLDLNLQADLAEVLRREMEEFRPDGAGNAALLAADLETGGILCYLGSDDYFDEDHKGAINYAAAPRSSGSTLKPFLFAQGMVLRGFTAATLLTDSGLALDPRTGTYAVRNYDERFLGPVLYRNALANSRNLPAVEVLDAVGLEAAYRNFQDLGLVRDPRDPSHYGLGLALGGLYVTLEDLVRAYGILARDGAEFRLRWVPGRQDPEGRPVRRIPADVARQITLFLSDPMARLPSFPRMGRLEYGYPVAVKTGTSQGFRDAWCVAYSDRYVVGAWVGHPDNYPMKRRCGANSAARLVHRAMDRLHPGETQGLRDVGFPPPRGYVARRICMLTGKLAAESSPFVALEWFRPGTEPVDASDAFVTVDVDRRTGRPAGSDCPAPCREERTFVRLDPRFGDWAEQSGLEVLPPAFLEPTLPAADPEPAHLAVREPPDGARIYRDPESPPGTGSLSLRAVVRPPAPQVVWYVDGEPYEVADFPYGARWSLLPGEHTFQVRLPYAPESSPVVRVTVFD